MGLAFEDFTDGEVIEGDPITVSRDEIVAFARQFDPQAVHLDEEAAEQTFIGTLIASGWHTACLGMRLLQRDAFRGHSSMGSPGIEELRWLRPVMPGHRLRARIVVDGTRASASKPDRGFVRFTMTLLDQSDQKVMTQAFTVMVARRGAAPLAPRSVPPAAPSDPIPESTDAVPLPFLGEAEIGTVRDLGWHRFEPDAIIAFAGLYDPQVFHTDPEAARETHFGGLCASGWHTASVWMKRLHETWARDAVPTAEHGPVPQLGPSPGFREMRWLRPVYAGDTIRYATRLVRARPTASWPGWGLATHHNTAENQRGEPVFEFTGSVFWQWAPA